MWFYMGKTSGLLFCGSSLLLEDGWQSSGTSVDYLENQLRLELMTLWSSQRIFD